MIWSLEYDISALAICTLFIIYSFLEKSLPIHRNKIFLGLLFARAFFTISDIVASVITSYPEIYGVDFITVSKTIYYLILALCPAIFAVYTYCVANNGKISLKVGLSIFIPFFILAVIAIMDWHDEYVFMVEENGAYRYGPGRVLFYYETLLYMAMSVVFAVRSRGSGFQIRHRLVLVGYAAVTVIVHTLQVFVLPYTQLVSLGSVLGITAMFLTFQNPEYYWEKRSECYNKNGLALYSEEQIFIRDNLPFVGFCITNYRLYKFTDSDYYIRNILKLTGDMLKKTFKDDVSFYFENGTFLVCLKDESRIQEYIDIITNFYKEPFELSNGKVGLEVSFFYNDGRVKFKDYADLRDTLYVATELATKTMGCATIEIDEELHHEVVNRRNVEQVLKEALDNYEDVLVYFQPIYSTGEKRVVAAEALVRLYDRANDRLINPDDFIYMAEKNGAITKLGQIVFEKTCKFIKQYKFKENGIGMVEVNLSPRQCVYKNLALDFIKIMEENGIDPKMITLEVTETEDIDKTGIYNNIERLKVQGIRFALDDYGTGYSNLVYILKNEFEIVKIDKSICWDYFREGNELLMEVIEQFKHRGKTIVVEGVEDREMVEVLDEVGVQLLQGYYFSKPVDPEKFIDYISETQPIEKPL